MPLPLPNVSQKIILPIKPAIQRTRYDCGPAALKTILDTLGHQIGYSTILRLAKTDREGTRPENLVRALKALRIPYRIFERASIKLLGKKIAACNLCLVDYQAWAKSGAEIKKEDAGHYSVIFGFNQTHFFLADPSKLRVKNPKHRGLRTIRKDLFEKRWHDRGPAGKTFHWMLTVPFPSIYRQK